MRRAPFGAKPWGPYEPQTPDAKADVLEGDIGPIDMRSQSAWRSLATIQCRDYSYGQIVVTCDARATSAASQLDLPAWPHIEVRLVARTRNQEMILLEAAAGSHTDSASGGVTISAGPVSMSFGPGEVPDSVEVLARARRGGLPQTDNVVDERLMAFAGWRFHL
jgi:hypothetical protein